jgi:hypothetical protein
VNRADLEPDRLYFVQDVELYAVTPDCWGVFWYDTLDELEEAYGETGPIYHIESISDF